uniref:Methyltransferase domain-containing protein n=1 Tax=Panagrolaimus sp. JU765 TaxID=591449 RepID=A0AC34RQ40_9BILA
MTDVKENFPVNEYVTESRKWLGRTMIVLPSIIHCIKDDLHGKTVLDVGCGNGYISNNLLTWGASRVVGIDLNHEMIVKCKVKYANQHNLEFREQSTFDLADVAEYDAALAIFVLHFSANVNELTVSLMNIARALKPGGFLLGFVPNGVGDLNPTKANGIKFGASLVLKKVPPEDGEHLTTEFYDEEGEVVGTVPVTFFYRATYESCLKKAGFREIEWIEPIVSDEGISKYGHSFFDSFFHPPKDILFKAKLPEN